ncbi:unnamed protein product [Calypogeia fissa]
MSLLNIGQGREPPTRARPQRETRELLASFRAAAAPSTASSSPSSSAATVVMPIMMLLRQPIKALTPSLQQEYKTVPGMEFTTSTILFRLPSFLLCHGLSSFLERNRRTERAEAWKDRRSQRVEEWPKTSCVTQRIAMQRNVRTGSADGGKASAHEGPGMTEGRFLGTPGGYLAAKEAVKKGLCGTFWFRVLHECSRSTATAPPG